MSLKQLLQEPFALPFRPSRSPSSLPSTTRRILRPRHQTTSSATKESRTRTRIVNLHSRLPRFLHPYTRGLLTAPISHIISFLILHEITAIVPLIGLSTLFHYTNWLPETWVEGRWVREGVERFGRWFGRRGWFGFTPAPNQNEGDVGVGVGGEGGNGDGQGEGEQEVTIESTEKRWRVGEKGSRILMEVATAYAITKVLLPSRILLSVWATPWFARVVVGRVTWLFGRMRGMKHGNPSAGLGASAGGVGGGFGKDVEGLKRRPP